MEDVNEMDEAGSGHANPLTAKAFCPKTKVEEFCDAFPSQGQRNDSTKFKAEKVR